MDENEKTRTTPLAQERREHILSLLRRDGKVLAAELSGVFDVSDDTVRRDLDALAAAGLLRRVHGGALPRTPINEDFAEREVEETEIKDSLARATAALVRPSHVVIMDGGTTSLAVARCLPLDLEATVVTTSPPVAVALASHRNVEVITIGGRLYRYAMVNVGAAAVAALRQVRADLCIIGVLALHPEMGLSVLDYEEAAVKRAMMEGSADIVAPASLRKLGTVAPFVVAAASSITHLVTESDATSEILAPYQALGITVIQA